MLYINDYSGGIINWSEEKLFDEYVEIKVERGWLPLFDPLMIMLIESLIRFYSQEFFDLYMYLDITRGCGAIWVTGRPKYKRSIRSMCTLIRREKPAR